MSIFEYDKELEEKKLRKAEYEAGREAGFSEGEKHGRETGFSEGEKYGIELNSIETARRMLQLQEFSLEKIAAISGLSLDEVKKLNKIIYVFLTIFLYLPKCPQSLILSALRAFFFCGKPHISRSIFLYFRYQAWLKSW